MAKEKWIKSPWTVSIVTAIFSLFLTMTYDYSKQKPILTTVGKICKAIWDFLLIILNFEIKVWWIIIVILAFIFIFYFFDKFKQEKTFKPDFYNYQEDKFKKWRWTWEWTWNQAKNAWIVFNMKAHCPNCNTPMIEYSSNFTLNFDCPRCDFIANGHECDDPHKIERIILDNIDRKRKEKSI